MDLLELGFGWRTALLAGAAVQCLALAGALSRASGLRAAHRLLAAALVVIAGWLIPYALGFAGAYDAIRALTFLPVAVPLAVGPLLYLYMRALAEGDRPARVIGHLVLPAAQWIYLFACFLLPLPAKWEWYTGPHRAWVAPTFDALLVGSLVAYSVATVSALRDYRSRLREQRSDDDRYSAVWMGRVLAALILGVLLQIGFWLWGLLSGGISFSQETGLYLGLAAIGVYLGVAGWRYSALPAALRPIPVVVDERPATDWSAAGAALEARVRTEGWWREPDLSLSRLASLVGSNTGRVSRIVNRGLGCSFSSFINTLRADAVAEALRTGWNGDLLTLAMDMGFSSKASFNRAFQARHGVSPSRYRREVSNHDFSSPSGEMRR